LTIADLLHYGQAHEGAAGCGESRLGKSLAAVKPARILYAVFPLKLPMNIEKEHREFEPIALDRGWETPPGYPPGIQQQILAGYLDEDNKRGYRTRHLRFEPGAYTTVPFVHDYWEEVYLISGDLIVGSDEHGQGGTKFGPNTYACRPPGVFHGPFKSETGCLLLEIHLYSGARADGKQ